MYDIDGDGEKEMAIGWTNGKVRWLRFASIVERRESFLFSLIFDQQTRVKCC